MLLTIRSVFIGAFLWGVAMGGGALHSAEPPEVPSQPLGKQGELLFQDDLNGKTLDSRWHKVVPTFECRDGKWVGIQTRDQDVPASEGKPAIKAHAAVHGLELPTKDSIVECRIRFEGATMIDVEFDDRQYKGAHYGHLCRAQVRLNGVTIIDERDGGMRNDIYEMKKDPAKKSEVAQLLQGRSVRFPLTLEQGVWYRLRVETVGDQMRVLIDDKPVAYHKSSGIAHPTKSKIEFGVAGKEGWIDDVTVWNALPAQP